ncbi:nose resistant to fluoxetine protein 6-like [Bombus impatiens]|uniref:Nose resistant to fluoxetine protein 6-like n=1 Tax=Bombus impatiens TaxID=132113 RepID=A0A6P6FH54_BOMIM|nr:nose resistant to fluoxetine protein 6-like [Bombus impatiens]
MNQYLLCFSLLRNVRPLFKIQEGVENLRIFYGIRALGMLWIILAHLFIFGFHVMANKSLYYMMDGEILMEIINNPTFSVDTFFFMSGFLSSYIFLKEQQKMKGTLSITEKTKMFFQIIMKRYIRLTPAYFVVILIAILNFTWHDHVSALLPFEHPSAKCSKYWWTNILYINNFYHWDDLCLTWSWYLPNDMQFFVFGNFLLILSITHYNIAIGLGVFSLVSSIGSVAYMGYTLNYEPTLDEQYKTLTYFYIRPWCRISPHLIGMATCHLLNKCNYELRLSKKFLVLGWTSTMQYHQELPYDDLVTLGLCLPASCTKHDVATMLDKVIHNETLFIGKLFAINFRLLEVTDLVNDYQWLLSLKIISIIGVLVLLCTIVIGATVYDISARRNRVNSEKEIVALKNGNTKELEDVRKVKCKASDDESALLESRQQNHMNQYLLCFSLLRNARSLFKIQEGTETLRVFYGMRVLGMLWIILGHLLMFGFHVMANKSLYYMMDGEILMEIINNPTFSVDTFFFMSGFLSSYIFLKEQQKMKGTLSITEKTKMFFQIIMKRYIRLTPAYFVVILIAILNFTWHDHVSALLPYEHPSAKCSKYWWTNILYINNFYHWDDLCLTWSWYLPNDMQFFVFGNFLLILSITHYNIAIGLGVFSLVSSIGSVAYMGYTLNYEPTLDEQYKTLTYFYIRPWCRISPHLIGMATCHLLNKCNYELRLSKKFLVLGWTLAILCNCSILFTPVNHNTSLNLAILSLALSRTGWALGIAWLVVVCTTNHAGIVKKILSLDIFVVLSKLTYGAYLLNPILILSAFSSSYYPFYADNVTIVTLFVTMAVCSFSASILLYATIEMPFMRLYNSARREAKQHNSS